MILVGAARVSSQTAPRRGDNFEPVACATFKIDGEEFECGYVRVPEFHADPDGAQIKLAVAILPSTRNSPTREAFVAAQGGPGGSTLDTYASFFERATFPVIQQLRAERDIVLYDQRGTLYAQPALMCPEILELTFATLEQEIANEEFLRQYAHTALACRERLTRTGVRLDAYNSFENARDIETLRQTLGYTQFDFYGVSYGTLLALHGLRETPQTFRSVILDAVVPAQTNPNALIAQSQQRAFDELFARCAADADCNNAYPNLAQVFYSSIDALNEKPARVWLTDDETKRAFHAVLDGDAFLNLVFQFIYNSEVTPALPQMIYDARDGRFTLVEAVYPLVLFDRTFASGMYYAVMCAEDADFSLAELALDGVVPPLARAQTRDTAAFLDLCARWNAPPLGARADEPVRANVPTLLLSGAFDPITPPAFGETAAETITPSYVFEFPAYGHGALTSGACPNEIIFEFVKNPARAPNAQCIARDAAQVNFITPTNTLLGRGIGKLHLNMLQFKTEYFLIPLVTLAMLGTVWVIAPLAWLIRFARKRPSETQRAARLVPWLVAGLALVGVIFFVIVFALLIASALQNENTMGLLVGAPRAWLLAYMLPLLFTVGALVSAVLIVLAWQRGNWGIARRVYYSILAVAALGLVAWFVWNDLLFAFVS